MTTYVRVKSNDTGHELSVPQELYDNKSKAFTKVDRPATDSVGTPLPPKYKTTVSSEAGKKSGRQADSSKEAN